MHEMSVALEICRITEEHVGRQGLDRVREIGLVVGRASGLEPDNLLFCLEALLEQPPFARARVAAEITGGDELGITYLDVEDERPPN